MSVFIVFRHSYADYPNENFIVGVYHTRETANARVDYLQPLYKDGREYWVEEHEVQ